MYLVFAVRLSRCSYAQSCADLGFDHKNTPSTSTSAHEGFDIPEFEWAAIAGRDCRMFRAFYFVLSPQITLISKSVQSGNQAPKFDVPTSAMISSLCFTCGIIKTSGKYSCCARGGTWFEECGDEDDANFGHTWTEGIEACKGTRWSAFLDISRSTIYFCKIYNI